MAGLLDSKFRGPFGLNFGLDSLIGLIPVWGDLLSSLASHYIVIRAIRMGCSYVVVGRMLINTYIDFFIGSVPVLGDLFDLFWKANTKNIYLLEDYLKSPQRMKVNSLFIITLQLSLVLIFFLGSIYLFYFFVNSLITSFQ